MHSRSRSTCSRYALCHGILERHGKKNGARKKEWNGERKGEKWTVELAWNGRSDAAERERAKRTWHRHIFEMRCVCTVRYTLTMYSSPYTLSVYECARVRCPAGIVHFVYTLDSINIAIASKTEQIYRRVFRVWFTTKQRFSKIFIENYFDSSIKLSHFYF